MAFSVNKCGRVEMLIVFFIGFNEFFSGFANIGHNDTANLILLWIIPK